MSEHPGRVSHDDDLEVCFTNFGPYHLARLRALARRLADVGGRLIAYEVAGTERTYPWTRSRGEEPFDWVTLFPDRVLESIEPDACRWAMTEALEHDRPGRAGDRRLCRGPNRWRPPAGPPDKLPRDDPDVREPGDRQDPGLVEGVGQAPVPCPPVRRGPGGWPSHRDYLVQLGMPPDRIAMGYNAVDNAYFASAARRWRDRPNGRHGLPAAPYFLTVCRLVREKNLVRLVEAFARYRRGAEGDQPWELVLCGDGPGRDEVAAAVAASGFADVIHRPGFVQVDQLPRWYAHAGAFVLPSLLEPWGLVANVAAASELPLVISPRPAVPRRWCRTRPAPPAPASTRLTSRSLPRRSPESRPRRTDSLAEMGRRAAEVVSFWGPGRFADGVLEARSTWPGTAGDRAACRPTWSSRR